MSRRTGRRPDSELSPTDPEVVSSLTERPEVHVPTREIGAAIHADSTHQFLALDPADGFDILLLNELRLLESIQGAVGDGKLLLQLVRRAEALMHRVKREVDDPLSAGAFLREQVLLWYRQSPDDSEWPTRMPRRWGGIFAESRTSGGHLQLWLNLRLWNLRWEAIRGRGLPGRVKQRLFRARTVESAVTRAPTQQIQAEVAQAILDDLATHARPSEGPLPLVRLSELAMRRQVPTVNEALGRLFTSPEGGPFVLLHPNRYPDCDELLIRPPVWGVSGAALAYVAISQKSDRRAKGGSRSRVDASTLTDEETREASQMAELDQGRIWELPSIEEKVWRTWIEETRREKKRLEAPPKDFRARPAYAILRTLLMASAELRTVFLAVKWRGRPSGLPLVISLLVKGSIAPEVVTDHEYLEAELGDLSQNDPQWKSADGVWTFLDWTVKREGSHQEGFRYRAEHAGPRSP